MIINGKEEDVATPITVAELIENKGLRADRVAVELNGEIVPRAQRTQTQLKGTDTLEIVTFVQGGCTTFKISCDYDRRNTRVTIARTYKTRPTRQNNA